MARKPKLSANEEAVVADKRMRSLRIQMLGRDDFQLGLRGRHRLYPTNRAQWRDFPRRQFGEDPDRETRLDAIDAADAQPISQADVERAGKIQIELVCVHNNLLWAERNARSKRTAV